MVAARVTASDLLTAEECVQRLVARKLEVALAVRPAKASMRGLAFEKLTSYPLCCAVAMTHPLAGKRSVTLPQLRHERLLGYSQEEYPEYLDSISQLLKPCPLTSASMEEYDSATSLITAVEAGRGIAFVSTSMKCLTGPRVRLLPITPALPPIVVGVISAQSVTPLVARFIAAAKQSV